MREPKQDNGEQLNKKTDVGIVGYWYATNYGSIITYYALSLAINKMGYTTMLIDRPEKETDPEGEDVISRSFLKKHCEISPSVKWTQLDRLNDLCDNFIVGSDQVWTSSAIKYMEYMFFLSFVEDRKKKIAYAPSFGSINFFNITKEQEEKVHYYLNKFDKISVREDTGANMVSTRFGIETDRTLDPVFLIDVEDYDAISRESGIDTEGEYILAYILDPIFDKEIFIQKVSQQLGLKVKIVLDGRKGTFDSNRQKFNIYTDENIIPNVTEADWIKLFKNAKYILTDSHHGVAMAIIFNKNYICYANRARGYERFTSLLSLFGMMDRMIDNSEQFQLSLIQQPIEYKKVNEKINEQRKKSLKWLKDAFEKPKKTNKPIKPYTPSAEISAIDALNKNSDFIKIRLLGTLLRDYGVKHVVLCPGGRDVPIVRMFEANEKEFILHRVTDERSAAYYGLGIATQLRRPVACVCTSGTAASNFLPAVTEAYYTGIPLIVITADRYDVYLNHGEDQTIPQKHIYNGVVKKEISLQEATGWKAEYQTRRDIADCILETTHNGFGPVHINIPIDNISIGDKVPKQNWGLLPFIYPHILRVGVNDGFQELNKWVVALKKSPKILIVYGQNAPISESQKNQIERFAEKYNCVIVTDHISNLNGKYCLQPFNMLRAISQDEFNRELAPDILITVGGKRLMNDPLTFKVRGGPGNIRHWSVTPDGKVKDFYFRLSSVIEMSQNYFFEWFAKEAGDISNNGVYYDKWRQLVQKHSQAEIAGFNSLYIQNAFLPKIPSNSVLHLGVGQTFFECRRFNIDKSVEVYCNMGTNGIDGCTSTFMGQCAVEKNKLCFLLVGDLSFFYDMNSIWNKPLNKNMRILMVNNNGSGLLRGHNLKAVTSVHNTAAEGWVKSTGFDYISARTKEEFNEKLNYFLSNAPQKALFFEVFCD